MTSNSSCTTYHPHCLPLAVYGFSILFTSPLALHLWHCRSLSATKKPIPRIDQRCIARRRQRHTVRAP